MKDLLLLIVLSFSWLFIYLIFKGLRSLFTYLFIEIPTNLSIFKWRQKKGINSLKKDLIAMPSKVDIKVILEKSNLVDLKIAELEYELYRMNKQKSIINLFLTSSYLKYYSNKVLKDNSLELDYNIINAFSNLKDKQESSCLNIKYTPKLTEKTREKIINAIKETTPNEEIIEILEYEPTY